MPLTLILADFATGPVRLSEASRRMIRLSALDWFAVGRAGATEPVARILHAQAMDEAGAPQAHLFGGGMAPVRMAALVNGTTSHALDYDDTHFAHIGHPSVAVFPAALAVAEWRDRSIADLLEAALIGAEISIRVGLWLGRGHYQAGFHQTATAGTFGAAMAAGRLLGLDGTGMRHALGLAATRAAGLKAQFGTMGKPYNAGLAASGGVEAALLARRGFESNPEALEGEYGFGATHHGAGDEATALDGLGERWLFEQVSHKFHACCHGLHAALEAARELGVTAAEIATLRVRTHPRWMSVCNQPAPTTGLGAKFSYGTVLAMQALGHDTARLESYSDAICADPALRALRERIHVEADASLAETEAVVELVRHDGGRAEARHDLLAPMPLAVRESRLRDKAAALIGGEQAETVWTLLNGDGMAAEFGAALAP